MMYLPVIPAPFSPRESGEGIHWFLALAKWIPAFAGMTTKGLSWG